MTTKRQIDRAVLDGAQSPSPSANDRPEIDTDWGEQLVFCSSPETGLRAIISIDSTVLGPAIGGTRMRPYATEVEALRDARRLAQAMTVKAALAGLPVGGGKAVIIADPAKDKSEVLLRSYGRFVDTLGGRYVAAQDVGTSPFDLDIVGRETPYVVGRSERVGGAGDPSAYTARGVFQAMRAVAAHRKGVGLSGLRVVVLGVGSVGGALVGMLADAGVEVVIADPSRARIEELAESYGVDSVPWETAHREHCDIFSPCALGGILTANTIDELDCWAIVGAANNQLADPNDAARIALRSIDYIPDFLASAGGLIAGTSELLHPPFNQAHAFSAIDQIHDRALLVLNRADTEAATPLSSAYAIAWDRVAAARDLPSLAKAGSIPSVR